MLLLMIELIMAFIAGAIFGALAVVIGIAMDESKKARARFDGRM